MAVRPVELPDDVLNDPAVVTRKAGLTPWHCRLLVALESIAAYYDTLPPIKGKGKSDA